MSGKLPPTRKALADYTLLNPSAGMYGDGAADNPFADVFTALQRSQLVIGEGLHFSETGLDIQSPLSREDWLALYTVIRQIRSAYQWIIGDWMLYGFEQQWSVSYEQMASITGLKASTVEVYTSICRSFPRLIRINRLSFGHFQLIAPLPAEVRQQWIDYAAEQKLSVRQLQAALRQARQEALPDESGVINKVTRRRFNRVWRLMERGLPEKIKRDDVRLLRAWLDDLERCLPKK
jgi:hypothetical protein